MSGQEIATREPVATVLSNEQLKYIASTEFVPKGLRGNLPAILACVATGRAIGVDDMTAIRSIHIIEGKPTFSAELMVMLIRRRGHSIVGGVGPGAAKVTGTRVDNGDTMTAEWTMEMAQRAGLAGKQNWQKYPEAMLWARAVSQLCKMLFADCFAGGTYTAEELGDEGSAGVVSDEVATEVEALGTPAEDNLFPPVNTDTGEILGAGSRPVITDAQRRRLRAIQKDASVSDERLKALVAEYAGVESSKLIPVDRYERLVEAVKAEVFSGFRVPEGVSGGSDA